MDRLRREDPDGDSARAAMGAARCSRLSPAVPTVLTVDSEETAGTIMCEFLLNTSGCGRS